MKNLVYTFLVLLPHRDILKSLVACKRTLFNQGVAGAWSFPPCAPLMRLARPLTKKALEETAKAMRLHLGRQKISGDQWRIDAFPPLPGAENALPSILGLSLDCPVPDAPGFRPLLAAALLKPASPAPSGTELFPPLSFRAAALANLTLRPLGPGRRENLSFAWKMGKAVWLPNPRTLAGEQLHA
jgi:hypothetical protein